ncbi:hypothetical protein B0H10DRAFT_2206700 [Mycena sp. CBHHK59/15]|nr:hypothetical protein B0H10DRAFT_2206700 [Mycena sp. CBHHK59/15]
MIVMQVHLALLRLNPRAESRALAPPARSNSLWLEDAGACIESADSRNKQVTLEGNVVRVLRNTRDRAAILNFTNSTPASHVRNAGPACGDGVKTKLVRREPSILAPSDPTTDLFFIPPPGLPSSQPNAALHASPPEPEHAPPARARLSRPRYIRSRKTTMMTQGREYVTPDGERRPLGLGPQCCPHFVSSRARKRFVTFE